MTTEVGVEKTISFNGNREVRYISVGLSELIKGLIGEKPIQDAAERNTFVRFSELLQADYHTRYFKFYRDLKYHYQAFNPDQDVLSIARLSKSDRDDVQKQLFNRFKVLLKKANYDELNKQSINQALEQESIEGISVDVEMDDFDEVLFFMRGQGVRKNKKRDWRTLFLTSTTKKVVTCSRLFVAIKFRSEEEIRKALSDKGLNCFSIWSHLLQYRAATQANGSHHFVLLSLFRDIPISELKMLFPNKAFRHALSDEAEPSESGGLYDDSTVIQRSLVKIWVILKSIKGLIDRVMLYLRNLLHLDNNYQRVLLQSLSLGHLDINVGVIDSLVDQAREEEIKEALLVYYFLMRAGQQGMTSASLKQKIESHLMVRYGVFVDFNMRELAHRLELDGLIKAVNDRVLQAIPIEELSSTIVSQSEDIFSVAKRLSLLGKI